MLVALPVTSFPPLAKLAGGTLVAPLSIFPLVWLFLTWFPNYLVGVKKLPGELKPLLWFILFTLISCGAAFFIKLPQYKGHTIQQDELEALVTLGIGLAFLLVTVSMIRTGADIKNSLVWINISGIIFLIWCLIQIATIWFLNGSYPFFIDHIQELLAVGNLTEQVRGVRISGLTLEPSWLAHSLNMLYLPIWLAASRYRVSAFRIRIAKISIENILLIVGIFAMIMTYSRVGLIGFLAVVAWLMVDLANVVSKRITNRQKRKIDIKRSRLQRIYITGSLFILLIIGFISLLYMLSFQDYRFKKIFTNATTYSYRYNQGSPALITLAKKINIGERVVYWEFGWEVFNKYPILGVGLGNVGRFSEELLSPEAWKMGEVRKILLYGTTLPNTKNLWVRILSETGIVGFSFYMTWLIILWLSARKLCQNQDATIRTIGLTGQFALIAQIFEGFSLDTFALPFLWVTLGILISTISISRQPIILHE
jgi:hypothetical protein